MNVIRVRALLVLSLLLATLFPSLAQELDLVGRVGWSKSGLPIRIYAERIDNNRTTGRSGALRLQVWATSEIYDGTNAISGYVLGTFNLGSLPAGSYFANPSRNVGYRRPPPGIYYTTITLEERDATGTYFIVDYENFTDPINLGGYGFGEVLGLGTNGDVGFAGDVSWLAGNGRVQVFAEEILNQRASGRSGILRIRLWATTMPYDGGILQGYPMTARQVGRVNAGAYLPNFSRYSPFRPPPTGEYYVTMTLDELVGGAWNIVDYVTFPDLNLF